LSAVLQTTKRKAKNTDDPEKQRVADFYATIKKWGRYALNKPTLDLLTGNDRSFADGLIKKGYMRVDADGNICNTIKGGRILKRMRKRAKRHEAAEKKKEQKQRKNA
jgi:hypothetical protein